MENNNYIVIKNNIFADDKFVLIKSYNASDTLIVIWFELLTLASRSDSNGELLLGKIPYDEYMLSDIMKKETNEIIYALKTFEEFEMIEIIDDVIRIKGWENYLCDNYGDKIREQNRLRQARYRANLKEKKAKENK